MEMVDQLLSYVYVPQMFTTRIEEGPLVESDGNQNPLMSLRMLCGLKLMTIQERWTRRWSAF